VNGNALGTDNGTDLAVGHGVVRTALNVLVDDFALFGDAGTYKNSYRFRILGLDPAGNRTHGRNGSGDIVDQIRIVQTNQIDKAGAAGGCQLFALPICFRPLRCFGISGHVTAQSDFYQIGKAHFLQSVPPAFESNAFAELSFCRGSKHGIDMFAVH